MSTALLSTAAEVAVIQRMKWVLAVLAAGVHCEELLLSVDVWASAGTFQQKKTLLWVLSLTREARCATAVEREQHQQ
jgi:hypothetical protein